METKASQVIPSQGNRAPTDHEVNGLIAERWSPRAFLPETVSEEDLRSLFEAARWAPSCFNEQPWRFLVATREQADQHALLASTLVDANRAWAKDAPVIGLGCAATAFAKNGKENVHSRHDLGQAFAMLSIEAAARGLSVHQMAGFDAEKARSVCGLPDGMEAVTAFVVGRRAGAETLPPDLAERERAERVRKPQSEFVFGATWSEPPSFG